MKNKKLHNQDFYVEPCDVTLLTSRIQQLHKVDAYRIFKLIYNNSLRYIGDDLPNSCHYIESLVVLCKSIKRPDIIARLGLTERYFDFLEEHQLVSFDVLIDLSKELLSEDCVGLILGMCSGDQNELLRLLVFLEMRNKGYLTYDDSDFMQLINELLHKKPRLISADEAKSLRYLVNGILTKSNPYGVFNDFNSLDSGNTAYEYVVDVESFKIVTTYLNKLYSDMLGESSKYVYRYINDEFFSIVKMLNPYVAKPFNIKNRLLYVLHELKCGDDEINIDALDRCDDSVLFYIYIMMMKLYVCFKISSLDGFDSGIDLIL